MTVEEKIKTAYHLYQKNGGLKSQTDWEDEILNPFTGTYNSWEQYFQEQQIGDYLK